MFKAGGAVGTLGRHTTGSPPGPTYGCYRQTVEAVCEGFPELDVVPPFAWGHASSV